MRRTERPYIQLNREELLAAEEDWHFDRGAFPEFQEMYRALLPLLEIQIDVAWTPGTDQSGAGCQDMAEQSAYCAVTLGPGIDRLQELCSDSRDVTGAYMLECLGSVLLQKAYDIVDRLICESTGLYVQRYIFPGDGELPLSDNARILKRIREADGAWGTGRSRDGVGAGKSAGKEREADVPAVSCNEAYVLAPQKSVVFAAVLGRDRRDRHLCAACLSVNCPKREAVGKLRDLP